MTFRPIWISSPNVTPTNGLASETQNLNWDEAPRLRQRISPIDRSMTPEQAKAYQAGQIEPPPQSVTPPPQISVSAAPAISSEQGAIPFPAPVPAPFAAASPAAVVSPVSNSTAPVDPNYPRRVNDRINKIWGQKSEAEERAARLEAQLIETNRRLDTMMSGRPASAPAADGIPFTNQFTSSPGFSTPQNGSPPAGQYISRDEMQAILQGVRRENADLFRLHNAHRASSAEAARDFPDVFASADLLAEADFILSSDRALQFDPNGPYKAAALARGLRSFDNRAGTAANTVADVRKTVLSGVGPSVPEGSGQPDQQQRYQQALDRARYTQSPEDFLYAMRVARGEV